MRVLRFSGIRDGWAAYGLAFILLAAFSWLGFASTRFGIIYEGLSIPLPRSTRLAFDYGAVAFPLFGLLCSAALLLASGRHKANWVLLTFALSFVLFVSAFRTLLFSGGVVMSGPDVPTTNSAHPEKADR